MQMASGDTLALQRYRFQGAQPGKKVYLQANLHGAELAGNAVIHQLIGYLLELEATDLTGEIWLVPMCNPLGVNVRSHHFASGRYNPYDGRDWNRIFWDYETHAGAEAITSFAQQHAGWAEADLIAAYRQQILTHFQAHWETLSYPQGAPVHLLYGAQLQHLCLDADYVIDLHTSTNCGMTYLYFGCDRAASAQLFQLDFGILLDAYDGDAFDEAFLKPWLALEAALAHLGHPQRLAIEAFTLELGTGMAMDESAIQRGLQGILNYLGHQGVLHGPDPLPTPTTPQFLSRTSQVTRYYAPTGGVIQHRVNPGTWVSAGDLLYELLSFNKIGQLPRVKTVCAHIDGLVYDISINHAVNQGEYVLAVLQPD